MSDYEAWLAATLKYIETCSLEDALRLRAIASARRKELSGEQLTEEDIQVLAEVDKEIAEAKQ